MIIEARRQWKLGVVLGRALDHHLRLGDAGLSLRRDGAAGGAARDSVLFGTALAMSFLGEHMTVRRWIAAGVIAAGAIMLQMG